MTDRKERGAALRLISFSIIAGFLLGGADVILSALFSSLTVNEVLFVKFGTLNLSLSSYKFIFLLITGAMIGLFEVIASRISGKLGLRPGEKTLFVVSAVGIAGVWVAQIVLQKNNESYKVPFLVVLAIALISAFLIISALFSYFIRRTLKRNLTERAFFVGLIIFFVSLLSLSLFSTTYFSFRFNRDKTENKLPNILLIVMDTVRADALSCYNHQTKATPNLDSISKEGWLFSRAISPAPWTLPAHASLFTGLYPSQHGAVWDNRYLDDEFFTLAEYLGKAGYHTVGFSENPFVSRGNGFAQGFREFYEMYKYPKKALFDRLANKTRKVLLNSKETREFTEDTTESFKLWVTKDYGAKNPKPFFAFLNLMPAHLPNYPRPEFRTVSPSSADLEKIEPVNLMPEKFYLPRYQLNDGQLETMRLLYEGDIAYLDSKIGEIVRFLKEYKILDHTITIITSDHGENFGDHGLIEHQFCLYNSLLHVPLIIRYPKTFLPGAIKPEMVSTIFLFRTLADLTGLPAERELIQLDKGSLLEEKADSPVYAEHENFIHMIESVLEKDAPKDFNFDRFNRHWKCIYGNDFKLIWDSNGQMELYRMAEDWEEETDLFDDMPQIGRDLFGLLDGWQTSLWRMPFEKRSRKIDKAAEEALRTLGYIK